jgi:hypothetical protein
MSGEEGTRKTCEECISEVTDVDKHISRSAEKKFSSLNKSTRRRECHMTVNDTKITYVQI